MGNLFSNDEDKLNADPFKGANWHTFRDSKHGLKTVNMFIRPTNFDITRKPVSLSSRSTKMPPIFSCVQWPPRARLRR